ncbi:MAG: glycoside hydrolase family 95 protein, partial [Clostridiales bacterium]|nr:glycoside hydrolase family 95 protein [Clostridiales bacterium]
MADLRLWYDKPAKNWDEALPIGNGRIGAMIFGELEKERIPLNEISMFSGYEQDADNPKMFENLAKVRKLLFEDKYVEAQALSEEYMICKGVGTNLGNAADEAYGSYQILGNLNIDFMHKGKVPARYMRELSLDDAIVNVDYEINGIYFSRETFSNAPYNVIVMKVQADARESISMSV